MIGAGTMGHGIAQVAALAGYEVMLYDADEAAVAKALGRVQENLKGGIRRQKLTQAEADAALARLHASTELAEAAGDADLVVEAIVEDAEVKRQLFRQLSRTCSTATVLASNTSSLSIAALAAATDRPGQVIGMHFFNPVHIMKLVEVVVHEGCAAATRETAMGVARAMNKEPIVVKDSPGFASSRLGLVLGLEAMRMVEQEVALPEDIDKAMTLGYGHPMGPLKLTDLVGLDVRLAIADFLHRELGGDRFRPPEILRQKVKKGELGKKTGQGFYSWDS